MLTFGPYDLRLNSSGAMLVNRTNGEITAIHKEHLRGVAEALLSHSEQMRRADMAVQSEHTLDYVDAMTIVNRVLEIAGCSVEHRQLINDQCDAAVTEILAKRKK